MSTDRLAFERFLADLGHQMGMDLDPNDILFRVDLNGVPFALAYDPERWGSEYVMLSCSFGMVPSDKRCAVYERLLELNLDMHAPASPVFVLDPRTGEVLTMQTLPLAGLDSGQIMQILLKHVAAVANWHNNHFLTV